MLNALNPPTIILDLDDFCEENHQLSLLDTLAAEIPGFQVTLFTIPGRCSLRFLDEIRATRPWASLVPHGWMHDTSRECQSWDTGTTYDYLRKVSQYGLEPGFKAPGWQISDATLIVMRDSGYWVADQVYNRPRRPHRLWYYELTGDPHLVHIHGHIGHLGGHNSNEVELIEHVIRASAGRRFDLVKDWTKCWKVEEPCRR